MDSHKFKKVFDIRLSVHTDSLVDSLSFPFGLIFLSLNFLSLKLKEHLKGTFWNHWWGKNCFYIVHNKRHVVLPRRVREEKTPSSEVYLVRSRTCYEIVCIYGLKQFWTFFTFCHIRVLLYIVSFDLNKKYSRNNTERDAWSVSISFCTLCIHCVSDSASQDLSIIMQYHHLATFMSKHHYIKCVYSCGRADQLVSAFSSTWAEFNLAVGHTLSPVSHLFPVKPCWQMHVSGATQEPPFWHNPSHCAENTDINSGPILLREIH